MLSALCIYNRQFPSVSVLLVLICVLTSPGSRILPHHSCYTCDRLSTQFPTYAM
ncbi:hypothetical protein NEOLEDRAFT_1133187 [Neolentinus lepideus HHB14362 ss-1]|uniref:Uncharacterized protein n=1 Tax=Neolentinus lepideus HHB14362 ss-1 TaxID=1314782 RepID=A0A165SU73_9AGAM|nr:hypothetical protein NEOLEDRAFT_1133187 [Neolentinus lepideus HHB14362 ss-1]